MVTDWWCGAVIHRIFPRSFMDSNGDGIGGVPGGGAPWRAVFDLSGEPASLALPQAGSPIAGATPEGRTLRLPPLGIFFGEMRHAA